MNGSKSNLEIASSLLQAAGVIVGVVISVLSFNDSRDKEAEARKAEAQARTIEAERPLRELRRSVYLDAVKTAAAIATPEGRSEAEIEKAKRRFRELYIAELAMVEDPAVSASMVALATTVAPDLLKLNKGQSAAFDLAKALKASYSNPLPYSSSADTRPR